MSGEFAEEVSYNQNRCFSEPHIISMRINSSHFRRDLQRQSIAGTSILNSGHGRSKLRISFESVMVQVLVREPSDWVLTSISDMLEMTPNFIAKSLASSLLLTKIPMPIITYSTTSWW
jgi:hypothetical protein